MPTGPVWASAQRLDPPKERPCATLVRWWGVWQISRGLYFRDFLPARAETRFGRLCWSVHGSGPVYPDSFGSRPRSSDEDSGWPAFRSGAPRPALSGLRRPSPQALTLLGGATFIAWRLRRSFLEECWRGPRHFWSHRACLGFGPESEPT